MKLYRYLGDSKRLKLWTVVYLTVPHLNSTYVYAHNPTQPDEPISGLFPIDHFEEIKDPVLLAFYENNHFDA